MPNWPGISVRTGQRDPSGAAGGVATDPNLGWKVWSKWSSCSHKGRRHRSRKCESATPLYKQCMGCVKEIDWCYENGEDFSILLNSLSAIKMNKLKFNNFLYYCVQYLFELMEVS